MRPTWRMLLAAAMISGLGACASQEGGPASGGQAGASILTAYHWQLQSGDAQAGNRALRLTFAEGRVGVGGLCNSVGGGYSLDGNRMTVSRMVGTQRMCADQGLMRWESEVVARLPTVATWAIASAPSAGTAAAPELTLAFADGSRWRLAGTPTDETRYGSKGELMFLEVAPELVACHHPLMPAARCMNVRTVTYGADGVKQAYGDWQPFYEQVQGYTHVPGVRNILRVKRYTVANPPADASSYAYVLDMQVESEQAAPRR